MQVRELPGRRRPAAEPAGSSTQSPSTATAGHGNPSARPRDGRFLGARSRTGRRSRAPARARAPRPRSSRARAAGAAEHVRRRRRARSSPAASGRRRTADRSTRRRTRAAAAVPRPRPRPARSSASITAAISSPRAATPRRAGERPNRLGHLAERPRIEGQHLRADRARRCELTARDRAHGAEILRHDQVRVQGRDQIRIHRCTASGRPATASRTASSISRLDSSPARSCAAVTTGRPTTSGGQRHSSRDADERVDQAQLGDHLGRTRQKRADPHARRPDPDTDVPPARRAFARPCALVRPVQGRRGGSATSSARTTPIDGQVSAAAAPRPASGTGRKSHPATGRNSGPDRRIKLCERPHADPPGTLASAADLAGQSRRIGCGAEQELTVVH